MAHLGATSTWPAAAAALVVAYTNQSLAGFLFLLGYGAWGATCVPSAGTSTGTTLAKGLWGSVSGLASLLLLVQLGAQAAYAIHTPGLRRPAVQKVLGLLGIGQADSLGDLLLVTLPVAAALLLSGAQIHTANRVGAARAARAATSREDAEGGGDGHGPGPTSASPRAPARGAPRRAPVPTPSSRGITGLVAVAAATAAALATPAVLQIPTLAYACLALLRWAAARGAASDALPARALQGYVGLVVGLLYWWQTGLAKLPVLTRLARLLGLFTVDFSEPDAAAHAASLLALLLLYAALGGAGATAVAAMSRVAEVLGGSPLLVGMASALLAASQPSLLGGVMLLLALELLLTCGRARGARALLFTAPRAVSAALLLWALAEYTTTALGGADTLPAAAAAVGLLDFSDRLLPGAPLAAVLGVAALLAATSRRSAAAALRCAPGSTLQPLGPLIEDQLSPRTRTRGGSAEPEARARQEAWAEVATALLRASRAALMVLVAVAQFVAGAALGTDAAHTAYLALLACQAAGRVSAIKPRVWEGTGAAERHVALRALCALHIAAIYAAVAARLPGTPAGLPPRPWRPALEALGLWDPSLGLDLLPILVLLLLACLSASLSSFLDDGEGEGPAAGPVAGPAEPAGPMTSGSGQLVVTPTRPVWEGIGPAPRLALAYGPAALAALTFGAAVVDCDRSVLGLLYVLLAAVILAHPPRRGRWAEFATVREPERVASGTFTFSGSGQLLSEDLLASRQLRMSGSHAGRWVAPAALAWLALADLAMQGALATLAATLPGPAPAALSSPWWHLVGLDPAARGRDLVARLARPAALLGATVLYRTLFSLAVLQRQLELQVLGPAGEQARRLRAQWGPRGLALRLLVLHAPKLLALACFAAAVDAPGAFGLLLLAGTLLTPPWVSATSGQRRGDARAMQRLAAALASAQVLAATWLLLQYALSIEDVGIWAEARPWLANALEWLGVTPDAAASRMALARALAFKAVVLLAVALQRKALRWLEQLPVEVREAGALGAPCAAFWPPTPGERQPELPSIIARGGTGPGGRFLSAGLVSTSHVLLLAPLPIGGALSSAWADVKRAVGGALRSALRHLDWPTTAPVPRGPPGATPAVREGDEGEGGGDEGAARSDAPGASEADASTRAEAVAPTPPQPPPAASGISGQMLLSMLQGWLEATPRVWNLDLTLFALLACAFQYANVLSLLLLALLAAGMRQGRGDGGSFWRWLALPLLGTLVLQQYLVAAGAADWVLGALGAEGELPEDVKAWLGLSEVDLPALWMLFMAYGGSALQVQYAPWLRAGARAGPDGRAESSSSLSHPLLGGDSSGAATPWRPMTYSARLEWTWLDWARFAFYRHSLHVLLVSVLLLCTVENDIVHAGYLAIALFLFRRRIQMRRSHRSMFRYLPIYNLLVMAVTLVYQAPFEDFFGWAPDPDPSSCNVVHLLGLYKIPTGQLVLARDYRGALADVTLWVLIRLQVHIFSTPSYAKMVAVVEEEEVAKRMAIAAAREAWKDRQAQLAVEESLRRSARADQVAKLKNAVGSGLSGAAQVGLSFLEGRAPPAGPGAPPASTGEEGPPAPQDTPFADQRTAPVEALAKLAMDDFGTAETLPARVDSIFRAGDGEAGADAAAGGTPGRAPAPAGGRFAKARAWLARRILRMDRESYLAYALFIVLFVADFSLLSLAYPLSTFFYALVSTRPSPRFWQAALIYSEALIIVTYAYQVPARLGCTFVSPSIEHRMAVLGVHSQRSRNIPLFLVYLATLMHCYSLATRHAASARVRSTLSLPERHGRLPGSESIPSSRLESLPIAATPSIRLLDAELAAASLGSILSDGWALLLDTTASAWEFLLLACTPSERPPAFVLATVQLPPQLSVLQGEAASSGALGEVITGRLQDLVDVARERAALGSEPIRPDLSPESDETSSDAEEESAPEDDPGRPAEAARQAHVAVTAPTPLHLRYVRMVERDGERALGEATVLVEVEALKASPVAGAELWRWPLRSLRPGRDAAAALLAATGDDDGSSPSEDGFRVVRAEHHARRARDRYAATAFVDFVAFVYVAMFYNHVESEVQSLSEITYEHVVPFKYLVTLIVLFMLIVLDRLFYTLGSPLGKALLHATQMFLFFWFCMRAFWSPAGSGGSHAHLRAILVLKSASFTLSALQLRTGYPPPAGYALGGGRHTFAFTHRVSTLNSVAFQAFAAVPFLYELRQLLDWSCTPTTLTFMDWLKLEDINMSLFFVAVTRKSRASKAYGARQPRYLKFFQGTLLFLGLLVLLWVPLLVFSSGNPTYQTPKVVQFHVNASLVAGSGGPAGGSPLRASSRFSIFEAGEQRELGRWLPDNASMPGDTAFLPDQVKLLCTSPDADRYWEVTPPARMAFERLLVSGDDLEFQLGWDIERDVPAQSINGGPKCTGTLPVGLSDPTRGGLRDLINGTSGEVPLLRANASDPGAPGTAALYPLVWYLRGDACSARPLSVYSDTPQPGVRAPTELSWSDLWVACNASLEHSKETQGYWWRLGCGVVDAAGEQLAHGEGGGWPLEDAAECSAGFEGPRCVALLERVQGGLIGQALSKYGIIGLYTVVVYGIGRFLRLSVTNVRMRIPFEDLPNTRRLAALCQDIYIARAEGELALEEELYWALVNVYRLPSVMFELTKFTPGTVGKTS